MNAHRFRNVEFLLTHTFSVGVAFASLIVIYLWLRPYSFRIAIAALCCLGLLKRVHTFFASRQVDLSQSLEANLPGVTTRGVEQSRVVTLVIFALLNASASIGIVACLLTVMHWYR